MHELPEEAENTAEAAILAAMQYEEVPILDLDATNTRTGPIQQPLDEILGVFRGRKSGSNVTNMRLREPVQYMELFFDEFIMNTFVQNTNGYTSKTKRNLRAPVSVEEIKGFLDALTAMILQY